MMSLLIFIPKVLLDVLPKVTNRGAACIFSRKSSVSMDYGISGSSEPFETFTKGSSFILQPASVEGGSRGVPRQGRKVSGGHSQDGRLQAAPRSKMIQSEAVTMSSSDAFK